MPEVTDPHPVLPPGVVAANFQSREPWPVGSPDLVAAAVRAVDDLGQIVSGYCASDPASLTKDRITAYALALIRLRECASAASLERLTRACDALAITVSGLIEGCGSVSTSKCEALKRFVVHAKEMIEMAIGHSCQQLSTRPAPAVSAFTNAADTPQLKLHLG
jgi:hypothetical protein